MYFLQHLLRMFPVVILTHDNTPHPPAGFSFVITSRGNTVVTARNAFVIAKEY